MLYRIIYKSKATGKDFAGMSDIIITSIENNVKDEITGLLVTTDKEYIQVLEGPQKAVNDTFIRIAKDDRHSEVELVSFAAIEKRNFLDWSMKGINFKNLHIELQTYLFDKYGTDQIDLTIPNDPHLAYSMLLDISYHFVKAQNLKPKV